MKRCPECRRDYYDDTLLYCLDDGNALLEGPATAATSEPPASAGGQFDEPQTAIFHSTAAPGEAPTRAQINTTDQTAIYPRGAEAEPRESLSGLSEKHSFSANRAAKPLAAVVVVVLILAGGFFGYRYFAPAKQIESIAVMPFVNESGNSDVEYLSDGMTETLIRSLSQLANLQVKPRSSVFRYKGKETDAKTIGRELNVQAILNGRVTQRGDQLTLNLELIDVQKDVVLWSEQYNRKQSDLVSLQSEIAKDVSAKLKLKLSGTNEAKVTKTSTTDPEAYQAYLKGRYYWNKRDKENFGKAIEQFKAATDRDPNYALAYAGLADCYALLPEYGSMLSSEALPQAKVYAERALEIDNSLGEAHISMANINGLTWNWDEANKGFERGIELNPNYATGHKWYGLQLATLSRFDEALAKLKRAQELEPLSTSINLNVADIYFGKGDFDAATEQCRRTIELDPNWYYPHQYLAVGYLKQGHDAEAVKEAEKSVELSKRQGIPLGILGYIYAQTGKRKEVAAIIEELKEKYAAHQINGYSIASVYVGLGEKEQAFAWLEKDFQSHSSLLPYWVRLPPLNSLRDDPRYKDLLKRMGLPE